MQRSPERMTTRCALMETPLNTFSSCGTEAAPETFVPVTNSNHSVQRRPPHPQPRMGGFMRPTAELWHPGLLIKAWGWGVYHG
ncbi:unnamed protein product [Boreogadus saida]